jgi:hypothetical protein
MLHSRFCDYKKYSHDYDHPEEHKDFILKTVKNILRTMATEDVKNYTKEELTQLERIFSYLLYIIDRNIDKKEKEKKELRAYDHSSYSVVALLLFT